MNTEPTRKNTAKKAQTVYADFVVKNRLDDPTQNFIGATCGKCGHYLCDVNGATSIAIRCRFCGARNNIALVNAVSARAEDDPR